MLNKIPERERQEFNDFHLALSLGLGIVACSFLIAVILMA